MFSIEETKSGDRRDIPINQKLFNALKHYKKYEKTEGEIVFKVEDINNSFKTTLKRAGIEGFASGCRHADVAQLAEQLICNQQVVRSIRIVG